MRLNSLLLTAINSGGITDRFIIQREGFERQFDIIGSLSESHHKYEKMRKEHLKNLQAINEKADLLLTELAPINEVTSEFCLRVIDGEKRDMKLNTWKKRMRKTTNNHHPQMTDYLWKKKVKPL